MDSSHHPQAVPQALRVPLAMALVVLLGSVVLTVMVSSLPPVALALTLLLFAGFATLLLLGWRRSPAAPEFGAANGITLARALLVFWMATLLPFPAALEALVWPFAITALAVLIMDGFDGAVARRTGTSSAFGARFDMELDAFYLLVLCGAVMALDKAGPWVLALGLMRYGFILAGYCWPALQGSLPESFRRKTVCVWQGVTLLVAVLPFVSAPFASWTLALALVLLIYSFTVDTLWLIKQHRHHDTSVHSGAPFESGSTRP